MEKYKITIPEPCHENWENMTPEENGRFCSLCSKSVIDFTSKTDMEIQHYFRANKDKKTCGRFNNTQLEKTIIRIPQEVLLSQVHFHRIFLLALLFTMGTTLFSCRNEDGSKSKIDGVEIGNKEERITLGTPMPSKSPDETESGDSLDTSAIPKHAVTKKQHSQLITVLQTNGNVALEPVRDTTPEIVFPAKDSVLKAN